MGNEAVSHAARRVDVDRVRADNERDTAVKIGVPLYIRA
jgi:hypothetical protein